MAIKGQILDLTPVGMKFTVLQASADTLGESLELHWELLPGCNMKDPLIHMHPGAIETYEVLEGEMEFFIEDKWIGAQVGDKFAVQKGVTHGFRNPTNQVVRVFNTHQPALRMEYYFEDVSRVLDLVTDQRQKLFGMNLRTLLYMGLLQSNYREEIIAQSPPDALIKVVGWLARRLRLHY